MKFKMKLLSRFKIIEVNTLSPIDNLEFAVCKCRHIPKWESLIIRCPDETTNKRFPWLFANTPTEYSKYVTSSAFKLEYLTSSNSGFYLVEP